MDARKRNVPDRGSGAPVDRRVRRTRHRLKAALLELLQARAYERISIEDIAERADVGRSTFYSHFDSKEDLLFAGFDEWMLSLADLPSAAADPSAFRFSRHLLEHVRPQRRFFQALFVKGSDMRARQRFSALLVELIAKELARIAPRRRTRVDRGAPLAHALAGAFLGLVGWWLEDGAKLGADEVDDLFQRVARTALA
jgi:AcrR family transcriptional regulator